MPKYKATFRAGSLARNECVGIIKTAAFQLGITVEINELRKTWFESYYGIIVTGPEEKLIAFDKYIKDAINP